MKDELAITDDLVLRDTRLVLPEPLHQQAIDLAHAGHQGIVRTKRLLREKVWFPKIDKLAEDTVKKCLACQACVASTQRPEPIESAVLPSEPWNEVSVDFLSGLPNNDYLLVVMDDYSRFPEVEIVGSTSAKTVIPKLDSIFACQGIPVVVKSDNGPPFNSDDFRNFVRHLGFTHRKVTPLWPQANGEVEHFMGPLMKMIRAAYVESRSWKQELHRYLRQYRATPHVAIGVPPAEALYGRKLRTTLESSQSLTAPAGPSSSP